MAGVPFVFGNATTSIPLSNLDANFNTGVTIGSTTVGLGNTTTTLAGLSNVSTTALTVTNDASISGLTVGKGGGSVASNTALGSSALYSNTTASNNTAVGNQSLYSTTTSSQNTAIGNQSGYSNTTGTITAMGHTALYSNTTGQANTGIGGYDNASGVYAALYANTTGNYNIAVGTGALRSNTTASNNTAVGYQSSYSNTTGAFNTFIGQSSGYANTTGQQTVSLGYQSANSLTTGSYGTYIGVLTVASSASVNYETVIGYAGTGKGASTLFVQNNGGGSYQSNNSTLWSITSDQRLKKNIVDHTEGLDKIVQLKVRNFEYRTAEEITELPQNQVVKIEGVQLGLIAQELAEILPDCVKTESTGVMSVDASNITWYLINAVKELNAKITALENK